MWGTPERAAASTERAEAADRHARRAGTCGSGDVADVRVAPAPAVIERDAVSRYLDVSAAVDGPQPRRRRDRGRGAAARRMPFPLEYHAEVLGDYASEAGGAARVLAVAAVALALVYLLLQAAFAELAPGALCLAASCRPRSRAELSPR